MEKKVEEISFTNPSDFPNTEFNAKSGGANASTIDTDTSLMSLQH